MVTEKGIDESRVNWFFHVSGRSIDEPGVPVPATEREREREREREQKWINEEKGDGERMNRGS